MLRKRLSRPQRGKLLSLLGGGKEYAWQEIMVLGASVLGCSRERMNEYMRQLVVDHALVRRAEKAPTLAKDFLTLTKKGDECLRNEMIARGGDYMYYKHFNRQAHGDGYSMDYFEERFKQANVGFSAESDGHLDGDVAR